MPRVQIKGWTYGEYDPAVNSPSLNSDFITTGYVITYKYKAKDEEDSQYTETVPKDSGDYVVMADVDGTASGKDGQTTTAEFTIAKAELSLIVNDRTITYGASAEGTAEDFTIADTDFKYTDTFASVFEGIDTSDLTYSYSDLHLCRKRQYILSGIHRMPDRRR